MEIKRTVKEINGKKVFIYDNIFSDEEVDKIRDYILQTKKKQGFIYIKPETLDEKVMRYVWRKIVNRMGEIDGYKLKSYSEGGVAPVFTITNNTKPIGLHVDKPLEEFNFKIKMGNVMYKLIIYVEDGPGTRFHYSKDKRQPPALKTEGVKGRVCIFDIRLPHSGRTIKPGQRKLLIGMRPVLGSRK